jgi:tRNA-dihydrouridine synthase
MATLSHRALRELIEELSPGACDLYYAEMIGAAPFLYAGRFEEFYSDPLPRPDRLVYQIVGGDAAELAKAAAILDGRGTAGIDVNMGCSAPEIVRAGGGVKWMFDQEAARAMIGGVRKAVKGKLSVKLRLGADEDFDRLAAFCRMLEEEGVQALTLHARTSLEKLRRRARWDYVGRLRAELAIPVAGNGDVGSAEELLSRASGPCDGVMVGRAAVRMPWIFGAAKGSIPPAPIDLEEVALRFLELLSRHQPPEFWETRSRRFFFYYCDNFKWAHHLRTALGREKELSGMAGVLRAHIAENPEERWGRNPTGS